MNSDHSLLTHIQNRPITSTWMLSIVLCVGISLFIPLGIFLSVRSIFFTHASVGHAVYCLLASLCYACLWHVNKKGHTKGAAVIFLTTSFFILLHISVTEWGVSQPVELLSYALLCTLAGFLLGSTASIVVALCSICSIVGIGFFEHAQHVVPSWKHEVVGIADFITYALMIGSTAFFSWMSTREIEKALARAIHSESLVRAERDALEQVIEERTSAWKKAELVHSYELARLAEFGKFSAGIVHDLLSPLTAASLSINQLALSPDAPPTTISSKKQIERAIKVARRIEQDVSLARKNLKHESTHCWFEVEKELQDVLRTLKYQACLRNVSLKFKIQNRNKIFGDPLKFYQIYTNIILNAIEAYDDLSQDSKNIKSVIVNVQVKNNYCEIVVEDSGCGMPPEILATIYDPFFTTKQSGIGIGLSMVKGMLQEEFGGSISYESEFGKGTRCVTRLVSSTS